jgi:hypothetical protein
MHGAARDLRQAMEEPQAAQASLREELSTSLAATQYGSHLEFRQSQDWDKLPVVDYSDLEPWIVRQRATHDAVLTPEPVLFFEKTSGSSGPAKFIPYTPGLKRSFGNLFQAWVHDAIAHGPAFRTGKLYFCISPRLQAPEQTQQGVQVGLENDSEYLPRWIQWFLRPFWVGPPDLGKEHDAQRFLTRLAEALLTEPELEILSIWNPSFLRVLFDHIESHLDVLLPKLHGRLSAPRRRRLERWPQDLPGFWPELKLISCWNKGEAAHQARYLGKLFPGVLLQGKGLLATEAPLTLPLIEANAFVPLPHEVLYEFEDSEGQLHPLHALKNEEEYLLVISQRGGLTRYRLGDRVRVTGRFLGCPTLDFLGRSGGISDLVGEKLHPEFVTTCLDQLHLPKSFYHTLIPSQEPLPHYLLLLDSLSEASISDLAERLDQLLGQAHHYQQARLLGQLAAPQVAIHPHAANLIMTEDQEAGIQLGDQKHRDLRCRTISSKLRATLGLSDAGATSI